MLSYIMYVGVWLCITLGPAVSPNAATRMVFACRSRLLLLVTAVTAGLSIQEDKDLPFVPCGSNVDSLAGRGGQGRQCLKCMQRLVKLNRCMVRT
jgi:hypothetical protein